MKPLYILLIAVVVAVTALPLHAAEGDTPVATRTALAVLNDTSTTVTLDVQDVPLHSVLRILSKQFGLSIITARNVDTDVSAQFKDVSL